MTEVCLPYVREGITWVLYFLLLYTLFLVLVLCLLILFFLSLYLDSQRFFYVHCQLFMQNCSSARHLRAADICRGMDLFESTVFGALILASVLSHVPCTEQQKRFIFVNSWKFVSVVTHSMNFDVLLTVHLSIFILVINQLDAQNLFYNKFISCLYMFQAPCAHRQEVKIVLYSLWYHHTYRWPSCAQVERGPPVDEHMVFRTCRGMK